ncbi:MAG TPA: ParB/RepB/Spo0J family partition protein [Acidimicrobiales bacterium]|nr:ParB/RepB/Spo0J family partition protein [Acidimicrobiales bacterium]
MARRSGLGRGLGALIPAEGTGTAASTLRDVAVGSIRPNPHQPRRHFDEEALSSLVASVRELGVLQPVLVRAVDEGAYELIAGERRWRAAKRAGLPTIPALVRDVDDLSSLEQALVENLHRQDLNPLEEAAAYQQLIEDFGLTHERLAVRVGKSRAAVTNTLRLFQLPPSIQRQVAEGRLSAGHARALLGTPDRSFQEKMARRAVDEGLSVRAVEDAVRARTTAGSPGGDQSPGDTPAPARPPGPGLRSPGMHELEELLSEHLATSVRVEEGGKRGRIVIDFADLGDLERIYRAMITPATASSPVEA